MSGWFAITKKRYLKLLLYPGDSVTYKFRTISSVLCVFAFLASLAGAQFQPQLSVRPRVRVTARVDRNKLSALPGTHPSVVARARIGARLNAGTQLQHMVLVLQPSDEQNAALVTLMDAQQDKSSASYHKWLTPDTYGQTFGVAPSDIGQVSSWLSDSGLAVESVSRSGRFITFSGPVGSVEAAFNTQMHTLTVDGETHISNTTDVSIPSALAPVVKGVARLNNFFAKSSARDVRKVTLGPEYGTSAGGTHYIGAGDLATIYNAKPLTSAGTDGTGVSISVLARSNIQLGDVAAYRSFFALPNNVPNVIVVGSDPGLNADDVEASLDAEMAGSLATGAKVNFIVSSVSLVGEGIDTAGLYAVDNNIGDIITLSYGGCEGGDGVLGTAFWNILWEEAAAQGQTVFVSTGDSSAAGCNGSNASFATGGYGVNALGSSNFNVAVGGSMFVDYGPAAFWVNTGAAGAVPYSTATTYVPEAAWNQGTLTTTNLNANATGTTNGSGIVGGGGGISILTARPSWQTGSGIPTGDPTGVGGLSGIGVLPPKDGAGNPQTAPNYAAHRLVPDVVMIASSGHDATLFCYEGVCSENTAGGLAGASLVGGTSVAAPAMASAQALIDAANGGRQGNANYYYYALANSQYTSSSTACVAATGTAGSPVVPAPASNCNFHDIVAGSNIVPTSSTDTTGIGFASGTGFDEASGLGSVNIANMAANWHSVNFHATATSLILTPSTGAHGATMIAAIQVTSGGGPLISNITAGGGGTPSGDVSIIASSFTATGTPQVFTLTGGAVNGRVDSLPAGSYNVHAHYAGDGVFASSDSAPVAVNISKEDSAFSSFTPYQITAAGAYSPIASIPYGSGELYLNTEILPASGNGTASGTVTYTVTRDGSPMPGLTTTLDTYGTTYLLSAPSFPNFYLLANYPTLPGGNYSITAAYAGDTSLHANTATATFAITPFTSTTAAFTTGTATINTGATATLNYSIPSAGTGAALATGTVTFTDTTTSTSLGSATVANGQAVFATTALTAAGPHNISAVYSGDSNYTAPSPAPGPVTVLVAGTASTTTTLTATTNPSVGTSIRLTATIASVLLNGTVSFYDSGVLLGMATPNFGQPTTAVLTGQQMTAGTHSLTAIYSGDATHLTSTGSLALVVRQNATSMVIGGTETSTYGQLVEINGTLTRSPTSSTVPVIPPTGLVNFYEGSTSGARLGSATLTFGPGGSAHAYNAVLSTSTISAGSHTIVAAFQGDANYAASNSGTIPLTVSKANQTITFTGLPANATYLSAGPYALNGTASSGLGVSYTVSGPASISGTTLTITGAGTVVVTASQAGNGNYNAATSVTQTIVVAKANQTISFTGLPATANFGSSGPYAVSATASSGLPVTFTVTGPATLKGTPLTLRFTGPGTVTVTASQAGNGNYNAAPAVTRTIVVGTLQLTATGVIGGNHATGYSMLVTVKNTGTGTAANVQLTTAMLGATNGTGVPASLGSIAGGGSASVAISFPSSTGSDGTPVVEKLLGTFTGGTFGGSFRAQLP